MSARFLLSLALLAFCIALQPLGRAAVAQPRDATRAVSAPPADLSRRIDDLARGFDGDVGVAVTDLAEGWTINAAGERSFPQQSVAKLWTALAVLDAADRGRLRLDDTVLVARSDLSVFNEPLAARVGLDGYRASLRELLFLAIVQSDNAANDILVRRLGGPEAVQTVMAAKGLSGIAGGIEQRRLQSRIAGLEWRPDYDGGERLEAARARLPDAAREAAMQSYLAAPDDGATPLATVRALAALSEGRLLSPGSTALLLRLMGQSVHGPDRLAGGLGRSWSIAHKTGTGQHLGLLHVGTNDVGLIRAPDGHAYAVAVFIGRSVLPLARREGLMRAVARAVVAHWRLETNGMSEPAAPG